MTFVITDPCLDTTDQSCIDVCPVDCIHYDEGADRMLYISPVDCIDCGACEPACPVSAIFTEEDVPEDQQHFTAINALWFDDPAAARAKVADIPAREAPAASASDEATEATEATEDAETAPAAVSSAAPAAAQEAAPAEPEAPADPGGYKYGDAGGIEGKCALCGTYVIKGGVMFRRRSVLCPDCASKADQIGNPYARAAGRR